MKQKYKDFIKEIHDLIYSGKRDSAITNSELTEIWVRNEINMKELDDEEIDKPET